jgi:hypothetical protein
VLSTRALSALLLAAVVALVGAALALAGATGLILPTHTPGARYSKVTQATIATTICKSGWTKTIRPPASYTNALKKAQLALWYYADQNPSHYGGPPDLARARRCAPLETEPLARTLVRGPQERPARERLAPTGL